MNFERKISGTKVTDYNIDKFLFDYDVFTLRDCIERISKQKTMDYILENFRFVKIDDEWKTIVDHDTLIKLTIMEYYPEYESELEDYFGAKWMKHYIRFNH